MTVLLVALGIIGFVGMVGILWVVEYTRPSPPVVTTWLTQGQPTPSHYRQQASHYHP